MDDVIFTNFDYMIRLVLSAVCAFFIGLERERRLKNAGISTHIIVAVSSCLMMIVSKYGFYDVIGHESISVDASRIAAGVVTAIGFLGAGVIYVRKENTVGLTTAAGLWATVGIGIALGAGMYFLGIAATALILLIQLILHHMKIKSIMMVSAQVVIDLDKSAMETAEIRSYFVSKDFILRGASIKRDAVGDLIFSCLLIFPRHMTLKESIEIIEKVGTFKSIDINMV